MFLINFNKGMWIAKENNDIIFFTAFHGNNAPLGTHTVGVTIICERRRENLFTIVHVRGTDLVEQNVKLMTCIARG